MKVVTDKIYESILYLVASIILAIALPIYFKSAILCVFGIGFGSIIGYKLYTLFKVKKEGFFTVDTICTGAKQDWINFGNAKIYEFEPLENTEFNEVVSLRLFNDNVNGLFTKKHRIRTGYGYTLVFKIQKDEKKITDQEAFIGLTRYVLPE